MRILKRVWKFVRTTVLLLLLLVVVGGFVLAIPSVQTKLAQVGANFLKSEFDVEVRIQSASFYIPNRIILNGVYAPDHRNDTMIYADRILFDFRGFSNNHLYAGKVEMEGGKLLMRKYEGDSLFNFAFWLEKFNSADTSQSEVPFRMSMANITVADFTYAKHPLGCSEDTCTWLDFYGADVRVSDFELEDSYITAEVEQLRYRDDRRFSLHTFRGLAELQPTYMELSELYFKTDQSEVRGEARLEYRSMSDFSDFLNAVQMKGEFGTSVISSEEFQSYIPQFPSFDNFEVRGGFSGTVHHLNANRMDIKVGESTFFGDVHITDCTEPDELYLDVFVGYCKTSGAQLNTYLDQFLSSPLPAQLSKLSDIQVSGRYKGGVNSFTTAGEVSSNLGEADVNLSFTDIGDQERVQYSGELQLRDFDLGELLEAESVGLTSLDGSIRGSGFTPHSATAALDVTASSLDFNGYRFSNLTVDGDVSELKFNGHFDIQDPNAILDFDGFLDFSKDTAALDFASDITQTDLHTLGLIDDTVSLFGAKVKADFLLYQDEWWQGQVELDSIQYTRGDESFSYNEVYLTSSNAGRITRNAIDSDIMEFWMEGQYQLIDVPKVFQMALASVNKHFPYENTDSLSFSCEYQLRLKRTDPLAHLLIPGVRFARNTSVNGELNSETGRVRVEYFSPGMDLYGTYFDTTEFNLSGQYGDYVLEGGVKSVFNSNDFTMDEVDVHAHLYEDSTSLGLSGIIRDSVDSDVRFAGYLLQPLDSVFSIHWDEGKFNVGEDTLVIAEENFLNIKGSQVGFENYAFSGDDGSVRLDGFISRSPYEVLRIRLEDLDLSLANYLLREPNTYFEGKANGVLVLNNVLALPYIAGSLGVDSLRLNERILGDLAVDFDWNVNSNVQRVNGSITLGTRETFTVQGRIAADSSEPLLLDLGVSRFRLGALNPYLLGIMDNLRGTVDGNIRIAGSLQKPTLNGELELPNAAFGIPFLGTDYNFEGSPHVTLSSDRILLDRVKIRDTKEGTFGYASGIINHKNLSDLNFDIQIEADEMLGLDLEDGENNFFYGKAYASGKVSVVGPTDQMNLRIDVEAERGTSLRLPLSSPTEVGKSEFITFVDPTVKEDSTAFGFYKESQVENLGGLNISVNANMQPEAEVRLVMDEAVGGEIIGNGSGLIKINLSSAGDLSILGNYEVAEGLYKFNMRNIVAKDFAIQEGSKLSWSGDPFDATIDLSALYTTRTTLTNILSPASGYEGQRVNVHLFMKLTGALMNPNIEFDIEVPNVNSAWQEEIRNRLSDQDKMMDNAFSLLVTNSFWNADNASIAEDVGQQSVNQLTSVMSNWAAQSVFGDIADINITYQTFENEEVTGSEVAVDLSKSFIDDRLTVNTNVDIPVDNTGSNDPTAPNATPTITGDVEVEYKITEDGRIRAKAFNRSNQNNPALDQLSPYSQGVSIFYRADFNTWSELVEKLFGRKPIEPQVESEESSPQATEESEEELPKQVAEPE